MIGPSLLSLGFLLQAAPASVPPPPARLVAECGAPVYAIDRLICDDHALAAQEAEIAFLLADAEPATSPWIEDQSTWLRRRAMCAFGSDQPACIRAANAERLALLTPASVENRQAIVCRDGQTTRRWTLAVNADATTTYDASGAKALVATTTSAGWTPFVKRTAARLVFRRLDGAVLRCHPA